jgi:hypothetical protein
MNVGSKLLRTAFILALASPISLACGITKASSNRRAVAAADRAQSQPQTQTQAEPTHSGASSVAASSTSSASTNQSAAPLPAPKVAAAAAGERAQHASPAPAPQAAEGATPDARVSELLRQAREALGGDQKLRGVRSLSAAGRLRLVADGSDQSGHVQLDMLLPDRLKIAETLSLIAGVEVTRVRALDGDKAWTDTSSGGGAGNTRVMILPPKTSGDNIEAAREKWMQSELARLALGLLLAQPSSQSFELTYAGEAEAQDGRADVLDVKTPGGPGMRLFLDQKTHRPLMISYRGVPPRVNMNKTTTTNKADLDKIIKEKTAGAAPVGAHPDTEIQLVFSDYRQVNGVLLPHRMSKVADGKVFEELEVTKYKLNPAELSPRQFAKN